LKAFCLAFAFLLGSLPVAAEELPQTSNASPASESALAQPGSFQWTVVDAAGAPLQAATGQKARRKDAPARAALAQMRAETERVVDEARQSSAKVQRIRYDLRVRCIVEPAASEPDPLANVATPWIWGQQTAEAEPEEMLEMCEIDYSQKVHSRAEPEPQMLDYAVSLPAE
jgi:hypothetical protein